LSSILKDVIKQKNSKEKNNVSVETMMEGIFLKYYIQVTGYLMLFF